MVVDKALESPTFPEEKKVKLRALKESGEFDKKTTANNPKVQKQIDNFVSREINKAIKQGRLPPKNQIKDVDFIKNMHIMYKIFKFFFCHLNCIIFHYDLVEFIRKFCHFKEFTFAF